MKNILTNNLFLAIIFGITACADIDRNSEKIDLFSVNGTYTNSTIALNGTGFVVVEDTISSDINTMSISSWIKPEFHVGNPQYTITSKENSFNLFIRNANVESPSHTIGFSVFDGVKWTVP